ncbi:MAG: hypothetical protein VKN33_06485 [Candidatus Sericytochromatia bacterium]|nr:hypothetical protein [Candidatus Sericytochromatia bacterium]
MSVPKKPSLRFARSGRLTLLVIVAACTMSACSSFNPEAAIIPARAVRPPQSLTPSVSQRLSGQALLGRQVFANAEVKVFNAATNQAIPIRSASPSAYRLHQETPRTDGQGNFSFQMPNPRRGDIYRVLVTDGQRTVTTLIGAITDRETKSPTIAFQSLDNRPINGRTDTFFFAVTPATTLADNSVKSLIPLAQSLTDDAESQLFLEVLNGGQNFGDQISRTFTNNEFAALLERVEPASGILAPKFLSEAVENAGLARLFKQTVAESLQLLSQLRSVASNLEPTAEAEVQPEELEALSSAGFDVKVEGDSVSISGEGLNLNFDLGGEIATPPEPTPIPPGTDPTSPSPTPLPPSPTPNSAPQDSESLEDTTSARPGRPLGTNLRFFNPQVKLSLSASSREMELMVSQAARQEDVEFIVARISKTLTGASFLPPATLLASGSSTAPLANGLHRVESGGTARTVNLSQRLGGGKLETAAFVGQWRYDGRSVSIAHVQVFDTSDYIYVTLQYALNDFLRINQGHTTTMTILPSVLSLDLAKVTANRENRVGNVDIDIYSRRGNLMEYSENVVVTS